jgi:hypothetical protein
VELTQFAQAPLVPETTSPILLAPAPRTPLVTSQNLTSFLNSPVPQVGTQPLALRIAPRHLPVTTLIRLNLVRPLVPHLPSRLELVLVLVRTRPLVTTSVVVKHNQPSPCVASPLATTRPLQAHPRVSNVQRVASAQLPPQLAVTR